MKLGFTKSEVNPNLYFKVEDDKPLVLVLYVHDLFLIGADPFIQKCKMELASEFEMKDIGRMHYFLGLEVWQKAGEIFLSQGKYVVKILERFGMVDCKPVTTPMVLDFKKLSGSAAGPASRNATEYRQLVGALMFLVNSRPNICFAVNTLSQHMVEPHHIHWIGAKNLLRYLRGTIKYGLRYTVGDVRLTRYTDADWASSVVNRKSTYGCCFSLGSTSISWMSRKQKLVALSTTKVEYIATSMASENPVFHDRSKNINIRYHYIQDMVQQGAIRLQHIGTDEQEVFSSFVYIDHHISLSHPSQNRSFEIMDWCVANLGPLRGEILDWCATNLGLLHGAILDWCTANLRQCAAKSWTSARRNLGLVHDQVLNWCTVNDSPMET
eukprot:PITA_28936